MKCCGSQIISTARNDESDVPRATKANDARVPGAREVAASFEAVLLEQAFAPIAKAMGFYGDTVVAAAAQSIARAERGGLADRLERAIASSADGAR